MSYNPRDHYWLASDGRLFSSARSAIVPSSDATFAEWTVAGGFPTVWPRDEAGNQTTDALQDVLTPYGIFADLVAYANAKQWELATSGYTTTIGGKSLTFATDINSQALLGGKVARLGQANPPTSVNWQFETGFVTLAAADFVAAAIKIADFVQATFDALKTIEAEIAASPPTIKAPADVDAALAAVTA